MGDECYFCGATEEIEEHHILPQRFDGSDAESNVVDVCHDCHWKLERLYNKDFWKALGIDDPRATQEKHVTCYWNQCQEHAVEKMTVGNARGDVDLAYYCEEHAEEQKQRQRWDEPDPDDDTVLKTGDDYDELDASIERITDHW